MIIVDNALKARAEQGKPIKVAILGGGFMAQGLTNQIVNSVPEPSTLLLSASGWRGCLPLEKGYFPSLDGLRGHPVRLPCATFPACGRGLS